MSCPRSPDPSLYFSEVQFLQNIPHMLQIIICCRLVRNATYMALPVSHAMLAGRQEMQAELSQEDLGASLSQMILLWCFILPFTLLLVATGDPQAPCLGSNSYQHALTHHPGWMLPKLWHPPWSPCVVDVPLGLALATALQVGMVFFFTTSPSLQYRSDPGRAKHVHISNRMRLSDPHVKSGHKWGL